MPSLLDLPSELIEQIVSYLGQPTLYAITQVSRSLYTITVPYLYRHVDLFIPPGEKLPRIDEFFYNVLDDPNLAKYVKSLGVGVSPREGVWEGQRFLPKDDAAQHRLSFRRAMEFLDQEPLVAKGEDLREAIWARDYGAYAALLVMILPTLQCLNIADHRNEALRPLHNILRSLHTETNHFPGQPSPSDALSARIASIEEVCYNADRGAGYRHSEEENDTRVWEAINLPGVKRLEFSIPPSRAWSIFGPHQVRTFGQPSQPSLRQTLITTLIIRHTNCVPTYLRGLLLGTPHLRSLTCELWHDRSTSSPDVQDMPSLHMDPWNEGLRTVRHTLQTLILSVEFYESELSFWKQADFRSNFAGFLDLRNFHSLQRLEVPLPFLTGDAGFSITVPVEPLLPTNLQHLSLRTDLSRAQFPYPFDSSIMPESPSFQDSREETYYMMGARMDLAYMFQAAMSVLDQLYHLKSITIWQPSDPSLSWFPDQLDDLATACRNKSVAAKIVYPMILRWKAAAHWDLVREVTLIDPSYVQNAPFERFYRGERNGVPLGLAAQYHLGEFRRRRVRRHR